MAAKTKLLWMSDSPTFFTGFASVTRAVLRGLLATGDFEVACLGWGYEGWPYDREELPFDIFPSRSPAVGKDTIHHVLDAFRPDVMVTLGDIWMVEWIKELAAREKPRLVAYVPIDGKPFYRPWRSFAESVDALVTCSKFGLDLVREALPAIGTHLIHHGVDTNVFAPLSSDSRPEILKGRFVVGCVARNQPRKNLPILIEAFARFSLDKADALLYLHTDPADVGWDVLDLLQRYGVFDKTCISASASIRQGVPSRKLNEIYNSFDVMVLPTAGEGFGLPILEAMAAGVPVVATAYSSCVELLQDRGCLVKVKGFLTAGRHNVDYAIPDVDDIVSHLDHLYSTPQARERYGKLGRGFALTLDWQQILPQWQALLESI